MTNQSFQDGDLVQLKSGGPTMTVKKGGDTVVCQWFAGKKLEQGVFSHQSLVVAKVDEGK